MVTFTDKEIALWKFRHGVHPLEPVTGEKRSPDRKWHTIEETGKEFGITRNRVRQIEDLIKEKIIW